MTTSSSHVARRADVLERGPVGEVAEEVGHLGVGLLGAEDRARDERALGARVLGVLDADPPPPWTTLAYSQTSPAAQTRAALVRRLSSQRTPPLSPSSSPAERASITSGVTPTPQTTRSRRELAPALRDHARDALVALEPLDLVAVDDADAALGEDAAEERADLRGRSRAPSARPRASRSSPACRSRVSDAATSQPMYDPPTQTTCSASSSSARIASALPNARR